ncbi:MAG: shikimate dehydrogenase [Parvularculaceae bacterium]
MNARPKTAGVIGWPIGHSLSPLIHRHWAEQEGVDAVYLPILVEPGADNLKRAVAALRAAGFAGVNVTLPHKEDALKLADTATALARAIGAANMLTFQGDRVHADNSDAPGFAAALEALSFRNGECRALVLGAGGSARAVVHALSQMRDPAGGEMRIAIANRHAPRAQDLARLVGGRAIPWEDRSAALADVDLLINATSLGMVGEPPLEIDLRALGAGAIVADLVYNPVETALLRAARARGLRTLDGLEMLMQQATCAYRSWFGAKASVDRELRLLLEKALAERARP